MRSTEGNFEIVQILLSQEVKRQNLLPVS